MTALPDLRQGFELALMTTGFDLLRSKKLVQAFNKKAKGFEKIKSIYFVKEIQKTDLFKKRQKLLIRQLGFD